MDTRGDRSRGALRALPALTVATATMYGCGAVLLVAGAVSWEPGKNPRWAITSLAVVAAVFFVWTVVRGRRFSANEALVMSAAHVATVGSLTWTTHLQIGAFANGTAFPIIGIYSIWFLHPVAGRAVLYAGTAWWTLAIVHQGDSTLLPFALTLVAQTVIATEVLARVKLRMDRLAHVDPLTGALNRRGVTEVLARELPRAVRRRQSMSVVVVDVDGLREVNNSQGHRAGDRLLEMTARHWRDGLRQRDAIGRTGGDEFLFVLPGTPMGEAEELVRRLAVTSPGSWSAGVAEMKPGDSVDAMLERADRRMYEDKAARQHA